MKHKRSSPYARLALCLAALACATACTTPAPLPVPPVVAPAPEPPPPVVVVPPPVDASELIELLAYHQRLRSAAPAELAREAAELGSPAANTAALVRKAMVLGLGREGGDLALAQQQLERAEAEASASTPLLLPLIRLLSAQMAEQRRLGESLAKLGQQLKDSQRRSEQLSQTLEALKAIEQRLPAASGNAATKEPRP